MHVNSEDHVFEKRLQSIVENVKKLKMSMQRSYYTVKLQEATYVAKREAIEQVDIWKRKLN